MMGKALTGELSCPCDRPCYYSNTACQFRALASFTGGSGGAMVLGKLLVLGVLLIWFRVGQGPIALAVGAGGGCLDIFSLVYHFSFLSPSLWETAQYRLKYCLKGLLSQTQANKQGKFQ